jgi:fission process protein 1
MEKEHSKTPGDSLAEHQDVLHEEPSRIAAYGRVASRVPQYLSRALEIARPLAYASEIGESFRHVFPYLVKPLYAISIGYVLADITVKWFMVRHKNPQFRKWYIFDLSLWHLGASLLVPAIVINRYIHFFTKILAKRNFSMRVLKLLPTATALCMIPFIIHPLDHMVDWVMDKSYRKYCNYKIYDDPEEVSPH